MRQLLAILAGADTAREYDTPLSWKETAIFLSVVLGVMLLAFYLHLEYPLLLAVTAVLGALLVMQNPVVWISLSILLLVPVFWQLEKGLTPQEVVHAVLYYGGLLWWLFHRVVIARKPLHWSLPGILSVALLLQMLLLAPVSFGYGAEPYVWLREMAVLSSVLMFIPIAHECDTRTKQYIVGAVLLLTLAILATKNIFLYKQRVVAAVWMWQVGASRASDTFYLVFSLAVLGMVPLLAARRKLMVLFWAGILVVGITSTVLSFYRTIWVTALASYALMFMMLGRDIRRRMLKYAAVVALLVVAAYPLFLEDVISVDVLWRSISSRFISIGDYRIDVSVENRHAEARAILGDIGGHWFLGKGMSVPAHFTKLTSMTTIEPTWTHNGFAWALRHFGIVGIFLLFTAWLLFAWRAFRLTRWFRDAPGYDPDERLRLRLFAGAAVAVILSTFLISLTINQFFGQEAGYVLAVLFGFIDLWWREKKTAEEAGVALPAQAGERSGDE
ncbi:MAG: hypothetical protein KFH87_08945 [Bacteroidetes bacterium]|nr:hypothetical protein [Bacteroidota bacterium]